MAEANQVSILEVIPYPSERVTSHKNGELIVLTLPRITNRWARKLLAPVLYVDTTFRLEEHGTAVWKLIDGRRTVKEIISLLAGHFEGASEYEIRVIAYMDRLHRDGVIRYRHFFPE